MAAGIARMSGLMATGRALTVAASIAASIAGTSLLLAACGQNKSTGAPTAPENAPADSPLPTREKTIGRVEKSLQKADDETAKRREEIDNATK